MAKSQSCAAGKTEISLKRTEASVSASLYTTLGYTYSIKPKLVFQKYSEKKTFNKYLQAVDKHTTTVYHWQLIQQLQKAETSKHENYF